MKQAKAKSTEKVLCRAVELDRVCVDGATGRKKKTGNKIEGGFSTLCFDQATDPKLQRV